MPYYYRAVWLSDAHLCSRDCNVEHLLAFIRQVRCDYLYLVGDIVEVVLGINVLGVCAGRAG